MKPRSEQCCGNCAAFVRLNQHIIQNPAPGQCRAEPPRQRILHRPGKLANQVMEVYDAFHPPVVSTHWCLCWQDRETHPLFADSNGEAPMIDITPALPEEKPKLDS